MAFRPASPDPESITADVATAIAEDVGDGDRTASLISDSTPLRTRVICRERAVLAGRAWFDETFRQIEPAVTVEWLIEDGDELEAGDEICHLAGPARAILTGERTALNFLQTLSGTATQARAFVDAVEGTGARVLDTRKTLPGLRLAQKYAVLCGGASNHRIGLFDAILIKENHIGAAGTITNAVAAARRLHPGLLLEVEVESLEQLREACAASADRALLDNFSIEELLVAVAAFSGRLELEASGNITLANIREVAKTGVDYISVGGITKNVRAIDFSMRFS